MKNTQPVWYPQRRLVGAAGALFGAVLLASSCASTHGGAPLPDISVYAPSDVIEPFIPSGELVDPRTATSLNLEQILVFADAHAPAIQTARARVGLARADVIEAEIILPANPQVSFGAGGRTIEGTTGFELEVAVEQRLEVGGQPSLRLGAARDRERMAEAIVNEVRWSVHVEVHRLFVELLLVQESLSQAERFVAFSQSMRDIAARQVDAGESSPLILLVADADLAQTHEALIAAQLLGTSLRTRLAGIVGWPNAMLSEVEGVLPEVRSAPELDVLLSLMAEHHPSLRTRELAVRAERSRVRLEEQEAWPEPTVGFAYAREAAPGLEPAADVWLFNVALPIPIWRTNQGERARAEADLLVADRERDQTAMRLRSDLVQAAVALNSAAERVALYDIAIVPQLEETLSLLQRAYELGEVDVHQVSQTRERLLNATSQYIDARFAYHESAAALEGLVGTEVWPDTEGAP